MSHFKADNIYILQLFFTSQLWGSGLDGSHATSHSVAHALQDRATKKTQINGNSLLTHDIYLFTKLSTKLQIITM